MLGADPTWVDVYVADDLHDRAAQIERLELRLLFSLPVDAQRVRVKLNGSLLQDLNTEEPWLAFRLDAKQLAVGRNLVTPDDSSPQRRDQPVSLEKAEIHVRYRKR